MYRLLSLVLTSFLSAFVIATYAAEEFTGNITAAEAGWSVYLKNIEFCTLPVVTETVSNSTSCDVNSGSITINVDSGAPVGNYDITWHEGSSTTGTVLATNTLTLTNKPSGFYTVDVAPVGVADCSTIATYEILMDVLSPLDVQATPTASSYCNPPNGTLSVTVNLSQDPASYSVEWTDDLFNPLPDANLFNLIGIGPGTYYVTAVELATGCTSPPTSVTVTDAVVYPTVTYSIIGNTSCDVPNGSVSPMITDGSGNFTYTWSSLLGFTASTKDITGLAGDTYTLLLKDNETGCEVVSQVSVPDYPSSFANLSVNGTTSICTGSSTDISVAFTGGVGPYEIEIDNGIGIISNYTSGQLIPVSPTATTTYKLTRLTDANGCSPDTYPTTGAKISVNTYPSAASALTFSNITNTSARISWTKGTGAARMAVIKELSAVTNTPIDGTLYTANSVYGSGQELVPGSSEFVIYSGSLAAVNVTGLSPGTVYHVAIFEYNGTCYSAGAPGDFLTTGCSVKPIAVAENLAPTICTGGTTAINLSSTDPNATFNWTVTGNGVSGHSSGSGTNIAQTLTLTGSTSQQVTYTVTPVTGTCLGDPITVIVDVQAPPTAFNVTGGGSICEGSVNTVAVGLDGSTSGISYELFLDGSPIETLDGTGASLAFTPVGQPGNYTVTATNTTLNCSSEMTGSAIVTLDPPATLTGTITGEISLCDGATAITYSVGDPGNITTFNWTTPQDFTIVSGAGTNTITVDVAPGSAGGDIFVTGTNGCGTSNVLNTTITIIPPFTVDIITEPEIFAGRAASFSVSTTETINSISWDFGDGNSSTNNEPSYTYAAAGNYTVTATVTSSNNCTAQGSTQVIVGELAKLIIKNVVTPNGDGANDVLYVENLTEYPGSELVFLDRWGNKIISIPDYQNDWDMRVNGTIIPAGNYVCLVKIPDGKVYSMTITVIRQ